MPSPTITEAAGGAAAPRLHPPEEGLSAPGFAHTIKRLHVVPAAQASSLPQKPLMSSRLYFEASSPGAIWPAQLICRAHSANC